MQSGKTANKRSALLAVPALLLAGTALAQDDATPEPAPIQYSEVWEAWTPTWSSDAIKNVAEAFVGSWKTTGPVSEAGGDADGSSGMLMTVSAAPISGVADALYVEQFRADNPGEPFRQSVMQIYTYKDGLRLRTYEILGDDSSKGLLLGMGHHDFTLRSAKRRFACEHMVQSTAETVYVGSNVRFRGVQCLLRRHVLQCAEHRPVFG